MHLYIHIPFCKQACYYCDFHFSTQLKQKSQLIVAICKEIELQKDYLKNKKLTSIYFGGGTPSLLNSDDFKAIFTTIKEHFDVSATQEITLEANPDDVNQAHIDSWKSFNFNRISLGIQSFDDTTLILMNRAHKANEAEQALELLIKNNMSNISADIIYSRFSDTNNELIIKDLQLLISYNLPHISAYNLTIEPKTVFGNWLKKSKITEANDDFAANQFEILVNTLENEGYEQYEISNFAKNNAYAVHNTSYWQNHEYLGIGPSAHSYNLTNRQSNIANNSKYIESISAGKIPCAIEVLTPANKANDYILTGLRTKWGIDLGVLSEIILVDDHFFDQIKPNINKGFFELNANNLVITKKGRIISDQLAADLFFA